jgi:hypothetical protein
MKKLIVIIAILTTTLCKAQTPYTNDSLVVEPLLTSFILDAKEHSLDVHSHIEKLDSILIKDDLGVRGDYYRGTIRIDRDLTSNPLLLKRVFYHEMGHHFKVKHCIECSYNIMAELMWGGMYKHYTNPSLQIIIYNAYFDMLKNPKQTNNNHKHY